MRILITLSFLVGLSHLGMGVDRNKYPYWPYIQQGCHELAGQTCDLRCEDHEDVECDQYCSMREKPCTLHCPKVKSCYQECSAGQTCQRISCEAKACSIECVPSCKEMICDSDKECYQRVGNESLLAVSRTQASCSGKFCAQSCSDKLCDFTCKSEYCRQNIANESQAVCNARMCEQVCEGGICDMECQRNAPNNINCTQYSVNGFMTVAGPAPTEETRRRRGMEGEEWGESSGMYNATEPIIIDTRYSGWERTTVPIKSNGNCFSKSCQQSCVNATCNYECRGSERCYQGAWGDRAELQAKCVAEDCFQLCRQAKSCDFTCQGKNCNMTCLGDSSFSSVCNLRCQGDDVENCHMKCEGHSQCTLDCGNAKRCSHSGHVSLHHQSACLQLLSAIFAISYVFMKM